MRRLRWAGIGVGSLVVVVLLGYGVVHALAGQAFDRRYPVPVVALAVPSDAESVAEGQRLATIRGCFNGCHGKAGQGAVLFDQPAIARIVAPNVVTAVRRYTPAQFATIVRSGVRPDGHSLLVMPSETFKTLTDEDMGRIIAFFRSLPATDGLEPAITLGPVGRLGLVTGQFKMAARLVADAKPLPAATDPGLATGRYLAATSCSECHGNSLRGASNPDFSSPDLAVVAAYSLEQFTALLRTGTGIGGRALGVMGVRSRDGLSQLTDAEIASLYGYLRAFSGAPGG